MDRADQPRRNHLMDISLDGLRHEEGFAQARDSFVGVHLHPEYVGGIPRSGSSRGPKSSCPSRSVDAAFVRAPMLSSNDSPVRASPGGYSLGDGAVTPIV